MSSAHTEHSGNPPASEPAREAARAWLVQLYGGQIGEQDRAQFAAWLHASDANAAAFAEARRLWELLPFAADGLTAADDIVTPERRASSRIVPISAGVRPAHSPRPRASRFKRWSTAVAAVAAVVVAAVGIGLWRQEPPPRALVYQSGIGEIKAVTLADGSRLMLDAATRIEVRLSQRRREVDLISGGAYFDVAHDSQRPFAVAIAETRITVLGTRFDARRGPNDVRISVAEGVVEVADLASEHKSAQQPGMVRLKTGEQITATLQGTLGEVHGFDAPSAFAWREGRLVYQDTPLADIVADLNRRRKTPIVLADPALGDLRLSASFRADQSDKMLAGLAALHSLELEDSGTQITIGRKP